ncbi:MAG TPA: efflux RND transporter periplasmic adaptor subunit [Pontiella sp.]
MGKLVGRIVIGVLLLGLGFFIRGFLPAGGPPPGMMGMQMPPATVKVIEVREMLLAETDEYIARIEPVQEVVIRPEVSGKIEQIHFAEGAAVNEGDLLFTIDRSAYQATADAAEAEMIRAQKRYDRLKKADARSVSASDLESAESDYLRGKAAYELAKVNLDYTEIRSPINGRIGAALVKKGNYVSPATVELARIVQLDPVRVVFSQTDREHLSFRRRELAGTSAETEARVILPDGTMFPNTGKKDFDDNAINPSTGTIAVRYLFDNPDGLLMPGGYVTTRLINPAGEKGIRIPQRALLLDQDGSYVLTVDEAGTVGTARVEAGGQVEGDVVILSGLKPGDRVVVDGIQKARPGATVQVIPSEG